MISNMGIIAAGVEVEKSKSNGVNTQWPETDYCPVSYFKAPKAHKGSDAPDAQTTYEGITYKFTNADVVAMFLEAPELFLPQYRAASTPSRERQGKTDATQVRRILRLRRLQGQARDGGPGRLRRAR